VTDEGRGVYSVRARHLREHICFEAHPDDERQLYQNALTQVELADRLGYDYAWEVEHHFLEEYSHSPSPEVFLGAASQRTKNIRLGHGIMLMLPGYNHPARAAERIATLDLVSRGRVEWGTGMSASRSELEGFGINPDDRQAIWKESVEQAGRRFFELVLETASGKKSKSELFGYGEDEFAPWVLGATM